MSAAREDVTTDRLLGGKLVLRQPARGHRAGTDAMLLIAAAGACGTVVDLGSGVGTVGLGLAVLGRAERVTLVERDPDFAALARENIVLNGMCERALVIEADIGTSARLIRQAGLETGTADVVVANPPFNTPGQHRSSPDEARLAAHAMLPAHFDAWALAAARALKPGGRFVLIHRTEALVWLLPVLAKRFGALSIRPVHTLADEPAKRILIAGRLGSKTPARLLPAFILHDPDKRHSAQAEAIYAGLDSIGL